jgi:hypothetical protein
LCRAFLSFLFAFLFCITPLASQRATPIQSIVFVSLLPLRTAFFVSVSASFSHPPSRVPPFPSWPPFLVALCSPCGLDPLLRLRTAVRPMGDRPHRAFAGRSLLTYQ